jgi:hypothetical protein
LPLLLEFPEIFREQQRPLARRNCGGAALPGKKAGIKPSLLRKEKLAVTGDLRCA